MAPLTILALLTGPAAHAADVDRFEPATSNAYAQGTLQGESPWLTTEGFGGGVFASYAQDPVVRAFDDGREQAAVAAMMPVALYGGYTLGDVARFELVLPTYAYVDAPLTGYQAPAFGDVRLQANVPVYADGRAFGVSLVPRIGLPTGTADALTRQGFQAGLLAALGGEVEAVGVGWVVNAGIVGAGSDAVEDVGVGSTFDGLVGGYWRASEVFRLGAELDLRAGLSAGDVTTSAAHVFAQNVLPSGIGMTVGAGTGLTETVGAPEYRAFAALTFGSVVQDRDGDGLADASDACAGAAEDLDGFEDADGCPDPDNDGDGIGDYTDLCDDRAEDLDEWEDSDGCPDPDNDGDRFADADDRCPTVAGASGGCPDGDGDGVADLDDACPAERGGFATGGCPDADGDAVADLDDACPTSPRPADEDLAITDGCPKALWLAGDRIRMAERVEVPTVRPGFLGPEAKAFLDELGALLLTYPQLKRIELRVHLDDSLEDAASTKLTQARAEALAGYVANLGIAPERLVAKGYGKTQPIDTNRTDRGRANNRRVELVILQQEAIPRRVPDRAVAAPARVSAPSPWGPADGAAPGRLTVTVAGGGWGTVYLDGKRLTTGAPFTDFAVPAGEHELRVMTGDGLEHRETIVVQAGQAVSVIVPERASSGQASPASDEPVGPPPEFDGNFPLFPPSAEEEDAPEDEAPTKRPKRTTR